VTPPRRACATCGRLTSDGYFCAACRPPRRCLDCQEPIVGRGRQATTCFSCAAHRVTHRKGGQRRSQCARCQRRITGRGPRAIYCLPCAAFMSRQQSRAAQQLALQPWAASSPARDPAIEAAIEAHLARIRASRRYRLTPEIIWARRTDLVAANAPEAE